MEASLFLAQSTFPAARRDARPHFAVPGRWPRVPMLPLVVGALEKSAGAPGNAAKQSGARGVPNSNYVVPLDLTPSFCRPLKEILRGLNKRVPDNIINRNDNSIPWYHANRMLSFYAPGWCGEVRNVIFSYDGTVTVVYRITVHGLDGEAHRESTGSVPLDDGRFKDPVAAAEELAFCKTCARFGFGLYLHHEDEIL